MLCKSFIIKAVGDIKWKLGIAVDITKKGSPKLKQFLPKNYVELEIDMLVSWIELQNKKFQPVNIF